MTGYFEIIGHGRRDHDPVGPPCAATGFDAEAGALPVDALYGVAEKKLDPVVRESLFESLGQSAERTTHVAEPFAHPRS